MLFRKDALDHRKFQVLVEIPVLESEPFHDVDPKVPLKRNVKQWFCRFIHLCGLFKNPLFAVLIMA